MWLAQLQKCLLEKKMIVRVQTRKRIKLALFGCHLSAWHYASQTAGRKRAGFEISAWNQTLVLVMSVTWYKSLTVPEPLLAYLSMGLLNPALQSCQNK